MGTNHIYTAFACHLFTILLFAIIYSIIWDQFTFTTAEKKMSPIGMMDFLFYSITIQSSVGLTDIVADTALAKAISSLQQVCLLGANAIALYFITK